MRTPPTAGSRKRLLAALGLLVALSGCAEPPVRVFVDLRTNLRAPVEFSSVEVALFSGSATALDLPTATAPRRAIGLEADLITGTRVGEFVGVRPGVYVVRGQVFDAAGGLVGEGLSQIRVDRTRGAAVVIDRDCAGVMCPGDGDATEVACLGGRCVDPRCPEDPSACPEAMCTGDGQCAVDGPECLLGLCIGGQCVPFADDSRCAGQTCDRQTGCVPEAQDAGADAGAGTVDSGPDAGPDAGADAGPDAGTDAGPDAGPPCTQIPITGFNISWDIIDVGDATWAAQSLLCDGTPLGASPHYVQSVWCNREPAPRSVTFTISNQGGTPRLPNPSIWLWRGLDTSGPCFDAAEGVGSSTNEITLSQGEFLTIRTGSLQEGATGFHSAMSEP